MCYEIFEMFLFDSTGAYINNRGELAPSPLSKNQMTLGESEDAKSFFRRSYRSTNKEELLKFIARQAPAFAKANTANSEGINLRDWYRVLSKVRHAIVHQLFRINTFKGNFTREQKLLFNKYFTSEETGNLIELLMTKKEANDQMILIAEYGFLIFKSLCIEEDLDWKVLMHME
jgi:hypothetical protein